MTGAGEPHLLDSTRLLLQQASPYPRALGVELLRWGSGHALTRVRPGTRNALSAEDPRFHPFALVGLLDDSFSYAIASVVDQSMGMSTLDLRVAFANKEPQDGELSIESQTQIVDTNCAHAISYIKDRLGATLAVGTAMFTLGSFPGGTPMSLEDIGHYDPNFRAGPYEDLIGLGGKPEALLLEADNPAIIGWESGNSIHGGVIGALLMAACIDRAAVDGESGKRLATLSIRYLRPASGAQPLHAVSRMERNGRTTSYIEASCHHDPGKSVATAQATFVRR